MISLPANAMIAHDIPAHARILFVSIWSSSKVRKILTIHAVLIRIIRIIGRNLLMKILSIAHECLISRNIILIILDMSAVESVFRIMIYQISIYFNLSTQSDENVQKFLYAITTKDKRMLHVIILKI